ncbi:HK97 gp10 family phage protein [Rhodococcus hoagii]|nr:HK97 gp10 family phage protein [Prescottella equi]NKT05185.1 HK97 gp10 family phage protein [Prescottella equi]
MAARVRVFRDVAAREARRISTSDRRKLAGQIANEARAAAPVLTGDYRDGIGVEVQGDRVFVVDDDPDAVFKEYGTSDTPAHAAMTDAARQYGKYSGWRPRGG